MPVTIIPDTGANNIYVNADTGRALIVTTGPNVLIPDHNALQGKQGGESNQYYHLTSAEYANLATGQVVRPQDTGIFATFDYVDEASGVLQANIDSISNITGDFYLRSNPSGYITGVDLSNYAEISYVNLASGELNSKIDEINSHSGDYYPNDNPSGFITGVDLGDYAEISYVEDVSGILNGRIGELESNTGNYYLNSNPSGFITGIDLSDYVTGDVVRPSETGQFYPNSNPSGFITGVDLSNYYTESEIDSKLSNTGEWNDAYSWGDHSVEGYVTGDVVRPQETGNFYTRDNPSGYITGVNLDSYATISFATGISGQLQNQITNLDNNTGLYYLNSNPSGFVTGSVVRPSDTGLFYPSSNPSGYISASNVVANYVALTGNQVISGVKDFVSGVSIGGNLTVDSDTLFVDSVTNRIGIGTTNPLATLSIGSGSLVDANLQVQISTAGSNTEANYSVNKNGQYGFLLGYKNNAVIGSIGSQSGGYMRQVTTDPFFIIVDNTRISTAWLSSGAVGFGGNITNATTLAGANMVLTSAGNLGVGTTLPTAKLHVEGSALITNDLTLLGSSRPTSAASGIPSATSLMTRDDVTFDPFWGLGLMYKNLATPALATSGTTGATAMQISGDRWVNILTGSANSGWARATIARGITTNTAGSGGGIGFGSKIGFAVVGFINRSSYTGDFHVFRIVVGSDQTPVAYGADPVTYRSFGLECRSSGTAHEMRAFGHNGTSITYSSWVNTGLPNDILRTRLRLSVESDGLGNITATMIHNQSTRARITATCSGGPTTSGALAQSYVDLQVANSTTATANLGAVFYDHLIYAY